MANNPAKQQSFVQLCLEFLHTRTSTRWHSCPLLHPKGTSKNFGFHLGKAFKTGGFYAERQTAPHFDVPIWYFYITSEQVFYCLSRQKQVCAETSPQILRMNSKPLVVGNRWPWLTHGLLKADCDDEVMTPAWITALLMKKEVRN